jgi:two-component system, chemotaxis family, response regulator WspR
MQHPAHPSLAPAAARIVVIDSHLAVRQGLATFLADAGYDLVFHPRATGALAVIHQLQPTLAIIDLHLDVPFAGLAVVRALRADPATTDLPLIVWSTDLEVEQHVAALHVAGVTVMSKYDAAATLRAAIAAAVVVNAPVAAAP